MPTPEDLNIDFASGANATAEWFDGVTERLLGDTREDWRKVEWQDLGQSVRDRVEKIDALKVGDGGAGTTISVGAGRVAFASSVVEVGNLAANEPELFTLPASGVHVVYVDSDGLGYGVDAPFGAFALARVVTNAGAISSIEDWRAAAVISASEEDIGAIGAIDLDASQITTGTLATARLGSGTADTTTYLRGDGVWEGIESGAVTVQSAAPTATTNAALGQTIYATAVNRLYVCTDATTNANVWHFFNRDGFTGLLSYPYPGGTLTNNVGANTAPNKVIADADIIWALGTNFGTTGFTNPVDGTRIIQTNSGILSDRGTPVVLADRDQSTATSLTYHSLDVSQSWFQFFFPAYNVNLTHIAIQQRSDESTVLHRTLSICYSSDGTNFTQAVSFTASTSQAGWSLIPITGWVSNRYLRVLQASASGEGNSNWFTASEILLYGSISSV